MEKSKFFSFLAASLKFFPEVLSKSQITEMKVRNLKLQ
jgi:hypothetical protein